VTPHSSIPHAAQNGRRYFVWTSHTCKNNLTKQVKTDKKGFIVVDLYR